MELTVVKAAPGGVYAAFALAFYVWHVGAALLGARFADRLGAGSPHGGPQGDLKRMALCSLISLAPFLSLFYIAQHPAVFIVYLLVFLVSLKFAYLGADHAFLLVVLGAALAGMIAFVPFARWLKLPGLFSLYLAAGIALLLRRQASQRRLREAAAAEERREREVRERFRRDPGFATFCHRCLFYRLADHRCLLRMGGEEVRQLAIDGRMFCLSFKESPGIEGEAGRG